MGPRRIDIPAKHWRAAAFAAFSLIVGITTLAQEPSQPPPQQPGQEQPAAQEQPPVTSRDTIPEPSSPELSNAAPPHPRTHRADGRKHDDLPDEAYAVVPGTKFLVRLEDELDTKQTHEKATFKVQTLEPLEAGSGIYLPAGAEIRGHVSRVEPAGVTGRAKIWLTFDDIHTGFGRLPIVAEVVSVPGEHSVKAATNQEGLIEGRTSTQQAAAEAAAEAAALGAVKAVKSKDKKEIAETAALAALTAYLMESGRGHELDLPPGSKLELELERALYLLKE
jgi:hypothetical protein